MYRATSAYATKNPVLSRRWHPARLPSQSWHRYCFSSANSASRVVLTVQPMLYVWQRDSSAVLKGKKSGSMPVPPGHPQYGACRRSQLTTPPPCARAWSCGPFHALRITHAGSRPLLSTRSRLLLPHHPDFCSYTISIFSPTRSRPIALHAIANSRPVLNLCTCPREMWTSLRTVFEQCQNAHTFQPPTDRDHTLSTARSGAIKLSTVSVDKSEDSHGETKISAF